MKTGYLLSGTLSLLFLAACGGEPPKTAPGTGSSGAAAPAESAGGAASAAAKAQEASAQDAADDGGSDQEPASAKRRIRRPKVNMAMVKALFGNETSAPKPAVASSEALVALGNALYHEPALSTDGKLSCASCHDLGNYGADGKVTVDGKSDSRNTPTTYNAFRQFAQFWDGRFKSVEDVGPVAHGLADAAELVGRIQAKPELVAGFEKAFPGQADAISAENVGNAIGAFERTLVTRSKWDDFLDGNQRALDNEELLGLNTFIEVGCTTCHLNRALGGQMFQKLGLLKPYAGQDTGRMQVTKSEADRFMFKIPTLLNVEKTGPYYHDGAIATLEEAITNMATIQLARELTPEQVEAIVAFLKAMTGELPQQFANK